MAELSQQDKDQIILEEHFRVLTKAELESTQKKKTITIWEFLNSSFGLLLMSSVVISGIGAAFTNLKTHHEKIVTERIEAQELQKRQTRIEAEIGYRLSDLLVSLSVASESPDAKIADGRLAQGHTEQEIRQDLNRFVLAHSPDLPPLYPEFANASVLQLSTELHSFVKDDEKDRLGQLIADMGAIRLMAPKDLVNPLKVASTIQQKINQYPRFRDGNFYFTDCTNPEVPFC